MGGRWRQVGWIREQIYVVLLSNGGTIPEEREENTIRQPILLSSSIRQCPNGVVPTLRLRKGSCLGGVEDKKITGITFIWK